MHFILICRFEEVFKQKTSQVYLFAFKKLSPGFSGDLIKKAVSKKSGKVVKERSKTFFNSE